MGRTNHVVVASSSSSFYYHEIAKKEDDDFGFYRFDDFDFVARFFGRIGRVLLFSSVDFDDGFGGRRVRE